MKQTNRVVLTCALIAATLGIGGWLFVRHLSASVTMSTPYQAVLLSNG